MSTKSVKAAVLGASGYTGAEMLRLVAAHPHIEVVAATANALAGQPLTSVYPHLSSFSGLDLITADDVDWSNVDLAISCLPHGTSQDIVETLPETVRVVDLSADYRFRSADLYSETYGRSHLSPERTGKAVYGLTEFARDMLPGADLVACPGCYPTATLLCLLPLAEQSLIEPRSVIIDAKSGASGAGRSLKEANLFCEVAEGLHPYGIGVHRHAPEIEQELSSRFGQSLAVTFTPHLVPMTRGELVTIYADITSGETLESVHAALADRYQDEAFVTVRPLGSLPPDTRHVRGTNRCEISVHKDRVEGRVVIIGAIDNLIKGSSGQALQNINLMYGWDEGLGLDTLQPLFP